MQYVQIHYVINGLSYTTVNALSYFISFSFLHHHTSSYQYSTCPDSVLISVECGIWAASSHRGSESICKQYQWMFCIFVHTRPRWCFHKHCCVFCFDEQQECCHNLYLIHIEQKDGVLGRLHVRPLCIMDDIRWENVGLQHLLSGSST